MVRARGQEGLDVRWVSTDWLQGELGRDHLTVLDAQPDLHDYLEEHIPGAVRVEEGALRAHQGRMPHAFAPPEAVQAVLRRLGVRRGATIVVYTGLGARSCRGDGLGHTAVAYALVRHGCERVYLLDGGLDKWKAEGRPLTKDLPEVEESTFEVAVRGDLLVSLDDLCRAKGRPDVALIDTRSPQSYGGQAYAPKPGHIPGAVNLHWATLVDDANRALLRPLPEVRARVEAAGGTPGQRVILSCGTGRTATLVFLLLVGPLGHPDVAFHEGAFVEWTSLPGNPTVVGPSPR